MPGGHAEVVQAHDARVAHALHDVELLHEALVGLVDARLLALDARHLQHHQRAGGEGLAQAAARLAAGDYSWDDAAEQFAVIAGVE